MKKLLAILGSLTMTVGGATSVVACGSKDNEKDDTGSVFIDHNGDLKIDSEALMRWYLEHKGVGLGNNIKQMKEFFQLFAAGIMKEAKKGENSLFKDIIPTKALHQYANENFQKTLEDKWGVEGYDEEKDNLTSTVWGAARNAFKKEKDTQQKSDGKNWQKNLVNKLAPTFPYVKKDYEALRKAFINNQVLTNDNNSALAVLTKTLSLDEQSYSKDFSDQSVEANKQALINAFKQKWDDGTTLVKDLSSKILNYMNGETNKNNPEYLNIVDLINATGGSNIIASPTVPKGTWNLDSISWLTINDAISQELIDDLLYRLDTNYSSDKADDSTVKVDKNNPKSFSGSKDAWNKWNFIKSDGWALNSKDTYFNLVDTYPNANPEDLFANGGGIYGWLTNSQRFVVDQYFETEQPVSISEVVFKKASDGKLEENINGSEFIKPTTNDDTVWTQFYGLYDFLLNYVMESGGTSKGITAPISGTSQYNFDTIFNQSSADKKEILLRGIMQNDTKYWKSDFYETKNPTKLLTLSSPSSDFSDITKYSVYDFLQANAQATDLYQLSEAGGLPGTATQQQIVTDLTTNWGFASSPAENIATSIIKVPTDNTEGPTRKMVIDSLYATLNLIKQLNRKKENQNAVEFSTSGDGQQKENKVYQVLNAKQGIIAFVDNNDGLHITKINGYDLLQSPTLIGSQTSNVFQDHTQEYINEANAFKKLQNLKKNDSSALYRYIYQDYQNQIGTDNGESDPFTNNLINDEINSIKNYGIKNEDLNQSITNEYERFLVNNSILAGGDQNKDKPPFYLFNILTEANDSITKNQNDFDHLSTNGSWLWDYMKNLLGFSTNKELLDAFMDFDSDDNTLVPDVEDWYLSKLKIISDHTKKTGWTDFINGWTNWNNTIDKTKKTGWAANRDLPLMKLAYGTITGNEVTGTEHLENIMKAEKFKPFAPISLLSSSDLANKILWENEIANYSFDILVGNYASFVFNPNKKGGRE